MIVASVKIAIDNSAARTVLGYASTRGSRRNWSQTASAEAIHDRAGALAGRSEAVRFPGRLRQIKPAVRHKREFGWTPKVYEKREIPSLLRKHRDGVRYPTQCSHHRTV